MTGEGWLDCMRVLVGEDVHDNGCDTYCMFLELVNMKFCTDREMGEKYRQEVLSHGGGKPPQAMVAEFLAREVTPHSMVDALMMDLDQKKARVEAALS